MCSVHNCQYINLIRFNPVDKAVGRLYYFTNVKRLVFRHGSA